MKKAYVKPEIYFESFELSANIATGCAFIANHAKDECGLELGPGLDVLFISATTGCSRQPVDGDTSVCYHVPYDSNKLFTS